MDTEINCVIEKIILALRNRRMLDWLPDVIYLKLIFRIKMHQRLELKKPATFNEKMQWLKLHDRNPSYSKMVDKYEVKKIVADRIGEKYIIPVLGIWDKFEEIDFDKLPNQFVLKCTHDSGGIVICKDKSEFNKEMARKKLNSSLRTNHFYHGREWPYKNVKPRIMAEKYMEDSSGELRDYKLMMFNGKHKCSFVCTERHEREGLKVTFFDTEWNEMPFERHYPRSRKKIPKPESYEEMIACAGILSRSIPFVRIDFYEIGNKPYFGEITFYPGSGMEEFNPESWDRIMGDWLDISFKEQ